MRVALIGGGVFGVVLAIDLANQGMDVTLFEAKDSILSHASSINQARLHTGLHYPRHFPTAKSALNDHDTFAERFAPAVFPVEQHYAIGFPSLVSFPDFCDFADKLGLEAEAVDHDTWFQPDKVSGMLKVRESTIDFEILRAVLLEEIANYSTIDLRLGTTVQRVDEKDSPSILAEGKAFTFDKIIIAAYAMNEALIKHVEIALPPTRTELTEVVIGHAPQLRGVGITVMDGDFWSTMPWGATSLHSLTSVALTPRIASTEGLLGCQTQHPTCGKTKLMDCGSCALRPPSARSSMVGELHSYLKPSLRFEAHRSLYTVKSVPDRPEMQATDGRPTEYFFSTSGNVSVVHSGKIGSAVRTEISLRETGFFS